MPQPAEARAWWAEMDDVKERIERRRAREGAPRQRGVRVVRPEAPTLHVRAVAPDPRGRRRPRARPGQIVGPRPDRIASWAVLLGFLLVLGALLSTH